MKSRHSGFSTRNNRSEFELSIPVLYSTRLKPILSVPEIHVHIFFYLLLILGGLIMLVTFDIREG